MSRRKNGLVHETIYGSSSRAVGDNNYRPRNITGIISLVPAHANACASEGEKDLVNNYIYVYVFLMLVQTAPGLKQLKNESRVQSASNLRKRATDLSTLIRTVGFCKELKIRFTGISVALTSRLPAHVGALNPAPIANWVAPARQKCCALAFSSVRRPTAHAL